MSTTNLKQRYQGSALITALFIMTLVAITVIAMSTRLQRSIYQTRLALSNDTLYFASQVVTFWAMSELASNENHFLVGDKHGKVLIFPPKWRAIYPNAIIKGELYDLQARFNLNNLSDTSYNSPFLRLLQTTSLATTQESEKILAALHARIHPPPSQSLNPVQNQQKLNNVSEFRVIHGVNSALYSAMLQKITALPEITPMNINTAPKSLLAALGHGLNASEIDRLVTARSERGITNLTPLLPLLKELNIPGTQLTTESHYFMSVATVSSDDLVLTRYSIIKRKTDGQGKMMINLINESLNSPS